MKIKSNWGIILIIFVIVSCFILLRAQIAFAGEKEVWFTPQVNWGGLLKSQKISGETLPDLINEFYKWATRAVALLAAIMFVVAGFQWMTAAGNTATISQAKQRMKSALLGLILVFGAYLLLEFVNPSLTVLRNIGITEVERRGGDCAENEIYYCGKSGCSCLRQLGVTLLVGETQFRAGTKSKVTLEVRPIKGTKCGNLVWSISGLDRQYFISNTCPAGKICKISGPDLANNLNLIAEEGAEKWRGKKVSEKENDNQVEDSHLIEESDLFYVPVISVPWSAECVF